MRKNKPSQPISKETYLPQRERKMDRTRLTTKRLDVNSQRRPSRQRSSLRAGFAIVMGRIAGTLSRRLHLGGGTSIVGIVAQRIYPNIVEHLATQLEYGSILVTGTNGKTTTSGFVAAILRDRGLRVWRNREGSNLMRGIAGSLVIRAQPNGRLRRSGRAISILEVDEAALPQVAPITAPRAAIFTNLFRDQLDRYGEVDRIITYWQQAIKLLPTSTTLVLNADDPTTAHLGETFTGKMLYYGIDDLSFDLAMQKKSSEHYQVMDTRTCPGCKGEYVYDVRFYSHMGHYHCTHCGLKRPTPDVRATSIQLESFDRLRIRVETSTQQQDIVIPLPGLYNIYNALAAITTALALDIDWEPIITGIEQSKPIFGRGERIQAEGRTIRLLLAKNPTGFNEVLRTLSSNDTPRHVLFILNDNIADGRDISWIWDVDFEQTVGQMKTLTVTGTRALDLALRLKYAGIAQKDMSVVSPAPLRATKSEAVTSQRLHRIAKRDRERVTTLVRDMALPTAHVYGLKNALDLALAQTPVGETLFIVPTYTGLLEVHRELEQRGLTPHYWEGKDG